MQLLAVVTGNLDSVGGMSFGAGMLDYNGTPMGSNPSRSTGVTDIVGLLPCVALVGDIEQPGEEQIRALMMLGANPSLAAPSGGRLNDALQTLDLFFSIDLYVNESNCYADYVLPGATMWEREDVPFLAMMGLMLRPSAFATPAIIDKQGEVKEDWEIMYELCRRLGVAEEALPAPRNVIDMIIRNSPFGDKFGENPDGLTLDKLLHDHPNGISLLDAMPVGIVADKVVTPDKRIPLAAPLFGAEMQRLQADRFFQDPEFPMRLHSMREVLTHNSWMHNAKSLAKAGRTHYARLHVDDAKRYAIEDGGDMRIRSQYGEVVVKAMVSDKMSPGNVALPHGWGHRGSWQVANERGGVNSNQLASSDAADTDRLSGGSVLNGIPIEISPVALA
jgi:formate dehydrogenase